ncbi:MAG: phosphate ABC transporter substrate-binding protein [Candidatus Cloacimonetes bacterium]|nr:phosphate ABC transporter substrate-binding protein [Candidatus Cloacimonadota bacterium]
MNFRISIMLIIIVSLSTFLFAGKKITLDCSPTFGPIAKAFAEYYMSKNKDVQVEVSESGSGNGAKSLINGTTQIGNMSRFMKEKEFQGAVLKGVHPVAHVVALDGLAIVVNKRNSIQKLSIEQIRKIYTGEISNWKEVGGAKKKIVIISRESNSGTLDTFKKFVMTTKVKGKKTKHKISPTAESQGSNGAVKQSIQSTENAIGFIGIGFVDKSIKPLAINGVKPNANNVMNGSYPISRPLFMFTNGYPKIGTHLHKFVSLYLTKDGQKLVKQSGYIPVTQYR